MIIVIIHAVIMTLICIAIAITIAIAIVCITDMSLYALCPLI